MKIKNILSFILTAVIIFSVTAITSFAAEDIYTINIDVQYLQSDAREMLSMINDLRKPQNAWYWDETDTKKLTFKNLKPLVYDYELEEMAMQRAAELAVSFDHVRPDGTSCFTIFGDDYMAIGENIAMGQRTAEEVFQDWSETNDNYMGQGHRRNMLSDKFTSVGIGHAVATGGMHFWVQEFRAPTSSAKYTEPCEKFIPVSIDMSSSTPFSLYSYAFSHDAIDVDKSAEIPETYISFPTIFSFSTSDFKLNNVTYSVADTSVAVVKNNTIYGISTGQTMLTISFADKKLEIPVNVISAADESDIPTAEPGDIDANGRISASDARLVLRASAKLENLSSEQTAAADVNGDNRITASDARKILRVSAKLETF